MVATMSNNLMAEAMYITWCGLGAEITDVIDTEGSLILHITVPKETTDIKYGNGLCGEALVQRIQDTLSCIGIKEFVVQHEIRDEVWSERKRREAEMEAKRMLFNGG